MVQVTKRGVFSLWKATDDVGDVCAYVVRSDSGIKSPVERFRGVTALADARRKFRKVSGIDDMAKGGA